MWPVRIRRRYYVYVQVRASLLLDLRALKNRQYSSVRAKSVICPNALEPTSGGGGATLPCSFNAARCRVPLPKRGRFSSATDETLCRRWRVLARTIHSFFFLPKVNGAPKSELAAVFTRAKGRSPLLLEPRGVPILGRRFFVPKILQ